MAGLWSVLKCGSDTGSCGVLPLCGRAPARALFSGHRGSGSMAHAWVGPLYWIQWAGGCRRLHPRGRRTGPGGEPTSPGLRARRAVGGACTERVRSALKAAPAAPSWPKIDPPSSRASALLPRHLRARSVFLGSVSGAHSRRSRSSVLFRSPSRPPPISLPRPGVRHGAVWWGSIRRGALRGARAAPPPLRCASFMAAW
jgi:hypothetical protein